MRAASQPPRNAQATRLGDRTPVPQHSLRFTVRNSTNHPSLLIPRQVGHGQGAGENLVAAQPKQRCRKQVLRPLNASFAESMPRGTAAGGRLNEPRSPADGLESGFASAPDSRVLPAAGAGLFSPWYAPAERDLDSRSPTVPGWTGVARYWATEVVQGLLWVPASLASIQSAVREKVAVSCWNIVARHKGRHLGRGPRSQCGRTGMEGAEFKDRGGRRRSRTRFQRSRRWATRRT